MPGQKDLAVLIILWLISHNAKSSWNPTDKHERMTGTAVQQDVPGTTKGGGDGLEDDVQTLEHVNITSTKSSKVFEAAYEAFRQMIS